MSTATDRARRRALLKTALACAAAPCAPLPAAGAAPGDREAARARFAFALIGDTPYSALDIQMLEHVYADFDRDLAFAIHVGDLKAGWERCDDTLLAARHALLQACPVPLVFVPGDNEWVDCARARAGGFDPRERLEWLRRHFFGQARPLGAARASAGAAFDGLERQADRAPDGAPENLRWRHRGVAFVTLNLPGGNNGLAAAGLDAGDRTRRDRLNDLWLRDSFELAALAGDAAVVVIAHANPRFDRDPASDSASADRRDGYAAFRRSLRRLSDAFAGPTLFVHGDTHWHTVQRITPKLLRVEAHGSPFSDRWVRVDVDAGAPEAFAILSRRIATVP